MSCAFDSHLDYNFSLLHCSLRPDKEATTLGWLYNVNVLEQNNLSNNRIQQCAKPASGNNILVHDSFQNEIKTDSPPKELESWNPVVWVTSEY